MNEKIETAAGFPDVPDTAWYAPFVQRAKDAGIMIGYEDGLFRPEAPLKRCEAAAIVAKLLEYIRNSTS